MKVEVNAIFEIDKIWYGTEDQSIDFESLNWFVKKSLPNAELILFDREEAGDEISILKGGEFTYKIIK